MVDYSGNRFARRPRPGGAYGFNAYAPGAQPGVNRFTRPDGSGLNLPSQIGQLGQKIRGAIDRNYQTPQGRQQAGVAGAQAAAQAGARGTIPGGPRPGGPPAPQARPPLPPPPQAEPRYAPGQVPFEADPQALVDTLEPQAPVEEPQRPLTADEQVREVLGPITDQQTTAEINPRDYRAETINGQTVLVRNGANLNNISRGDLMSFENGGWGDAPNRTTEDVIKHYGI